MSDWTDDYQKPELIRISEQIFRNKEQKKEVELALSELKLQYRYISVRKDILIHKALLQLVLLIVTFFFAMIFIGDVFSVFLGGFLLLFDVYLLVKEAKVLSILILSSDTERLVYFAERHDIKTFPRERKRIENQMQMRQLQIDEINQKITELELQKKEYLKTQEEQEATLRKHGVLFDEKPEPKSSDNLSLKESTVSYTNASELYEYYVKEERYINEYLLQLDGKLQYINKEIFQIEEDFGNAKKKILIFVIVFVFVAAVQSTFEGMLSSVTNIICFAGSIIAILFLEKTCKQPILLYLVEQESNLTKEYAFVHNLSPVKNKRTDLLEKKESSEKELAEIRQKKRELSFE